MQVLNLHTYSIILLYIIIIADNVMKILKFILKETSNFCLLVSYSPLIRTFIDSLIVLNLMLTSYIKM